ISVSSAVARSRIETQVRVSPSTQVKRPLTPMPASASSTQRPAWPARKPTAVTGAPSRGAARPPPPRPRGGRGRQGGPRRARAPKAGVRPGPRSAPCHRAARWQGAERGPGRTPALGARARRGPPWRPRPPRGRGGGGRAAPRLGAPVTAVGFLAGHAGRWVEEALAGIGVSGRFTWVDGETRTCVSILDRATAELTEIYEPTPPPGPAAF